MPRSYQHISNYEKEILELKSQGMTLREIGNKYGFTYEQISFYTVTLWERADRHSKARQNKNQSPDRTSKYAGCGLARGISKGDHCAAMQNNVIAVGKPIKSGGRENNTCSCRLKFLPRKYTNTPKIINTTGKMKSCTIPKAS